MKNTTHKHYKSDGPSAGEKAISTFSSLMVEALTRMKASDWKQGWISTNGKVQGLPQNIAGRVYNGTNSFFLQMDTAMHGYKTPVYMTYRNIQKEGAHVLKGSTSMPVVYWDLSIKDQQGHRVSIDDFRKMTAAQQQQMDVHPFLKAYNVFNLAQTNFEEAQPEKYTKILARFQGVQLRDTKGMYENKALDRMFARQEWVCPIQVDKLEPEAYYSPREDRIVMPTKAQFNISKGKEEIFKDGMEYYGNALHEMTHSLAIPSRLNRPTGKKFGDRFYSIEEVTAELTSALVGSALGFEKRILDNNAAYVDGWLQALNEEPKWIVSVMAEVNKASRAIMEKIDVQRIALGERPLLGTGRDDDSTSQSEHVQVGQSKETADSKKSLDVNAAKAMPTEKHMEPERPKRRKRGMGL